MAQLGRPRTFDRDVAITQALHLFWEHGYDATSLSRLKATIGGGITAPSFYAAFGSKQALFNEVMERYLDTYGRVTDSLFDTNLPPRDAIELTLRRSAKMQCERGIRQGAGGVRADERLLGREQGHFRTSCAGEGSEPHRYRGLYPARHCGRRVARNGNTGNARGRV